MTEIAKRATACKGWRWMPGMLTLDGRRVVGVDGDVLELFYADEDECYPRWTEDAEPDLADPATLGCLLAMVREAHSQVGLCAIDMSDGQWQVLFRSGYVVGTSEAEALVAVLEAAP